MNNWVDAISTVDLWELLNVIIKKNINIKKIYYTLSFTNVATISLFNAKSTPLNKLSGNVIWSIFEVIQLFHLQLYV